MIYFISCNRLLFYTIGYKRFFLINFNQLKVLIIRNNRLCALRILIDYNQLRYLKSFKTVASQSDYLIILPLKRNRF